MPARDPRAPADASLRWGYELASFASHGGQQADTSGRVVAGQSSTDDTRAARARGDAAWRASPLAVAAVLAVVPPAPARAGYVGDGLQVVCSRADFGCVQGTGYHGQSVWGANYGVTGHNCTSYVSYLLAKQGVAEPWHVMGNANTWDDHAKGKVPVDDIPAVGAVAQWEGHSRYASGRPATSPSSRPSPRRASTSARTTTAAAPGGSTWPGLALLAQPLHPHPRPWPDRAPGRRRCSPSPTACSTRLRPRTCTFGAPGDVPVRGDWDGDGQGHHRHVPGRHLDPLERQDRRQAPPDRGPLRRGPATYPWWGTGTATARTTSACSATARGPCPPPPSTTPST